MKQYFKQFMDKVFCMHEWQMWREIHVEGPCDDHWYVYHFNCKKCGKFKKIKS